MILQGKVHNPKVMVDPATKYAHCETVIFAPGELEYGPGEAPEGWEGIHIVEPEELQKPEFINGLKALDIMNGHVDIDGDNYGEVMPVGQIKDAKWNGDDVSGEIIVKDKATADNVAAKNIWGGSLDYEVELVRGKDGKIYQTNLKPKHWALTNQPRDERVQLHNEKCTETSNETETEDMADSAEDRRDADIDDKAEETGKKVTREIEKDHDEMKNMDGKKDMENMDEKPEMKNMDEKDDMENMDMKNMGDKSMGNMDMKNMDMKNMDEGMADEIKAEIEELDDDVQEILMSILSGHYESDMDEMKADIENMGMNGMVRMNEKMRNRMQKRMSNTENAMEEDALDEEIAEANMANSKTASFRPQKTW